MRWFLNVNLFQSVDSDGNGTIEFEEFLLLMQNRLHETTFEEDLRKAFDHFDTDHDGYISQKELKKAMKKNKMQLSKTEINVMMKEADSDGDGMVSFEEFVSMMTQK